MALFSLQNVPSKKIDAQVFSMLQDALKLELIEKEKYKLAFFASECLKRLYGQNYHADGHSDALFNLCNAIIEKENSSDPIYDKKDSKNDYIQRVVLSFLVKYEPKKSRQLFAGFQSSDKTKTLSDKLEMLSEPTSIEPWMLDFLKAQLGNKQPAKVKKEGLGQQHSVRFCDLAAQIIANHYLETPVQLELKASPAYMDGQIARIKRALVGEKDIDFSPPKGHQRD